MSETRLVTLRVFVQDNCIMDELLRDFLRRVVYIRTQRTVAVIARKPRARRGRRRKK